MARDELVLGIDFGTSFSTAAAWVDGRLFIVPDERGEPCVPSLVHVPPRGDPTVGYRAHQMSLQEPQHVVRGIKRILGQPHGSRAFRVFEAQNAVRVRAGPNNVPILKVGRRDFTAVQLAAEVFKHLRDLAQARFRLPVRRAVVTLPTSADAAVQAAVIQAAKLAKIDVVQTIPEPTAGALAYGLDRDDAAERKILVYDFGGGTFDVTVLLQTGTSLRPLALGGDALLGGDDLDEALAKRVASHVWQKSRMQLEKDVLRWQRVLFQSEQVKRALSGSETVHMRIRDLFTSGDMRDLDLPITREDANVQWRPFVDQTLKATALTMVQTGLRPADIDEIALIGGTTYIPLVQQMVQSVLGRAGVHRGDPQTAVAAGAAILAARVLDIAA